MTRPRVLAVLVAVLVVVAGFVVRDSVPSVGDGMCGTPWSYGECLEPVVFFAGWGAALSVVLAGGGFVLIARRRPTVLVVVAAAAIGLILGSPAYTKWKPDGCNDRYGYTALVLRPANSWLMQHGVGQMRGGYQTLMNCFTSA